MIMIGWAGAGAKVGQFIGFDLGSSFRDIWEDMVFVSEYNFLHLPNYLSFSNRKIVYFQIMLYRVFLTSKFLLFFLFLVENDADCIE